LLVLKAKVLRLHSIKALYKEDKHLKDVVKDPSIVGCFTLQNGFLLKGNTLCIPKSPLRDLIFKEAHRGALVSNFGIKRPLRYKEHLH